MILRNHAIYLCRKGKKIKIIVFFYIKILMFKLMEYKFRKWNQFFLIYVLSTKCHYRITALKNERIVICWASNNVANERYTIVKQKKSDLFKSITFLFRYVELDKIYTNQRSSVFLHIIAYQVLLCVCFYIFLN